MTARARRRPPRPHTTARACWNVQQAAADASIDFAQRLETAAAMLRARAREYRAGTGQPGYDLETLPPEAGEHMRHPASRALADLRNYAASIAQAAEQVYAALDQETTHRPGQVQP